MSNIKFSILVPAYNAANYILYNLNSIKNQSYTNWEIVIVNDGSTDNTHDIVSNYILNNPQLDIKLIDIHNGGLANARNIALKAAQGDFFCNLDADDYLGSETLQKIADAFGEDPCDVYYYDMASFEDGRENNIRYSTGYKNKESAISGLDAAVLKLKREIWMCQGAAFYNLNMIKENDLWNVPGINQGEDMYFITSALMLAERVKYIPYLGFFCRVRRDSMMHSKFNPTHAQSLSAIKNLKNRTRKYHYGYKYIDELLLYIDREYLLQYLHVAKMICDRLGEISYRDVKSLMQKYLSKEKDFNKNAIPLLSRSHRIQLRLTNFPFVFSIICKLYYRLK